MNNSTKALSAAIGGLTLTASIIGALGLAAPAVADDNMPDFSAAATNVVYNVGSDLPTEGSIRCADPSGTGITVGVPQTETGETYFSTFSVQATPYSTVSDYTGGNGIYSTDIAASGCAASWSLTGRWVIPEYRLYTMPGGDYIEEQGEMLVGTGPVVTPSGWLTTSTGDVAATMSAPIYYETTAGTWTSGSYVAAIGYSGSTPTDPVDPPVTPEPETPVVTPAPPVVAPPVAPAPVEKPKVTG